ncbi:hypothetical protein [Motiliproteus sediminis]|uniref:hypothetical protein n=1 Tax=Motiliproteus sediminis TaxID=1468178 RepID=UPI001AEFEB51|nr:hypothetical protein [Motiliproteus sediminis]
MMNTPVHEGVQLTPDDWFQQALGAFAVPKPAHFTDYRHCDECAEHDDTLRRFDVHSIGAAQLCSPSWDPITFASPEGKRYYLPAMIRLAASTLAADYYLDQLLFHLLGDGENNTLVAACTPAQRALVVRFLIWLLEYHLDQLDNDGLGDQLLQAVAIWDLD